MIEQILILDDDGNEDDPFDEPEEDWIWQPCSCKYCMCMQETEYGVICDDCLAGVHKG